jgi:prophage regulatory protein
MTSEVGTDTRDGVRSDDPVGRFVMTERMVLWPEVHAVVGLSRTTVWRMERAGQFPRRVLLSVRAVGGPKLS